MAYELLKNDIKISSFNEHEDLIKNVIVYIALDITNREFTVNQQQLKKLQDMFSNYLDITEIDFNSESKLTTIEFNDVNITDHAILSIYDYLELECPFSYLFIR